MYSQTVTVRKSDTENGKLRLGALLHWVQEVSGGHCRQLQLDWDTLAEKGMFWAVLRHRVEITRLPEIGEQILLETWPMPTTRVAYPRAVQAKDSAGNILFCAVSLWGLMDQSSRTMILPGKSGIDVPGEERPCIAAIPGSLSPVKAETAAVWQVSDDDLDVNNHVNNAVYVDRAIHALPPLSAPCRALTVCYLSEVYAGQKIDWSYAFLEGCVAVDGYRTRTDVAGAKDRAVALRLEF